MKPAKKKDQGAKKGVLTENNKQGRAPKNIVLTDNNKIPNYFQPGAIPGPIIDPEKLSIGSITSLTKFGNTKPIYVDALKKILESRNVATEVSSDQIEEDATGDADEVQSGAVNVVNDSVEMDISYGTIDLPKCERAECLEKDRKYKDLMKLYLKSLHRYSELEHKHNNVLNMKTRSNQPVPEPDDTAVISNEVFTPNEVKYLLALPLDKAGDSTFINKCLQFAYKDRSVLRTRTLKGKSATVQCDDNGKMEQQGKKDPLSPVKVQCIKDIFMNRLSKCKIDSVAFGERIKDANINRLLATGIINVSKRVN